MLSEMMRQQIITTMFHACTVENRRYTAEEYMDLTHAQKFKLSLIHDASNCSPGSYDATQKNKFPDGYFNHNNWPNGGPF